MPLLTDEQIKKLEEITDEIEPSLDPVTKSPILRKNSFKQFLPSARKAHLEKDIPIPAYVDTLINNGLLEKEKRKNAIAAFGQHIYWWNKRQEAKGKEPELLSFDYSKRKVS